MKRDIEVEKLIVNPENYRFDPVDSQSEAVELMLEEKGEEIVNLARHIFKHGLDKAKDFRVLEVKKDLYTVLDGNRRVTAIKCLHDPSLVKDEDLRNKFLNIRKGKGSIPSEVNCFIYDDEEDASEWIKLDHTGKNYGIGQDPWELAGKDRFDYKFGGKTSPATQVLNLFKRETKQDVDTKALKMSTVNRILSNPESRSYLGIDIKGGTVILTSSKKEVIERLDKLFNKIIVDNVPVRDVYKTDDSIKFMTDIYGSKPKISNIVIAVTPGGLTESGKKSKKNIPRTADRKTLIPKDCVLEIHEPKINNIYHELKSVQISIAPNAMGVLFRVFLEISLDYYADKYGMKFKQDDTVSAKITKISDGLERKKIADASQLKNIRSVAAKGNSILSIERFHEYVHSFKTQPAPIDLIYKWDNLQEFFELLWMEIDKKKKP